MASIGYWWGCGVGLVVALNGGCGDSRLSLEPYQQQIRPSSWTVTPRLVEMSVGDTVRFQVTLFGQQGDTLDLRARGSVLGGLPWPFIIPYPLEPVSAPPGADPLKYMVILVRAVASGDVDLVFSWGYNECVRDGSDMRCDGSGPWVNVLPPLRVPVRVL